MAQAGEVFINFGANTQGLLTGTARAGNILSKFAQTGAGAAVVVGASFVTMSRAITNFAAEAVNQYKDFNFEITRAKAMSGATEEEFIKLTAVAQELGRVTEYTATQAAEGMVQLALSGFNVNEIIGILPSALQLATAASIGLEKTTTIMSNAMKGFGMESDRAVDVANILTATFNTTNTTLESLSQTLKNATGPLSILGVKMEEVSAAAGVLGDVGIMASVAGTGLKNFGIKLAKTFGIMKDGETTSKKYFENLGITRDMLFDVETGTFDMVKATMAFKKSMDMVGAANAPEWLGQFSTLFGERNAVSLTALVKQADNLKVLSEKVRLTEMVGDIQDAFKQMTDLGNETKMMSSFQEGLHDQTKAMVESLGQANSYMEEFTEGGRGAYRAIERVAASSGDVEEIMKRGFKNDPFTKTEDGLMAVYELSKNNSKEMNTYSANLTALANIPVGDKRRKALEDENKELWKTIGAGKQAIENLTQFGRSRLMVTTAGLKYVENLQASSDGTSKLNVQLKALSDMYKGNMKNVAIAVQAMDIHIDKNTKIADSFSEVKKEILAQGQSADITTYAMQKLMTQAALVNTVWDMQKTQLQTLHGVMEIFNSNMELVSNKIAQALSPAILAFLKSGSELLGVLTLNNEQMMRGTTSAELYGSAMNNIFLIFKQDGGILKNIKDGFEGLSSIGKGLAIVVGTFGAAGLLAGGAFIWVQALVPAFTALAGTFTTIVIPLTAIAALAVKMGIELNTARVNLDKLKESLKGMSLEGPKGLENIRKAAKDMGVDLGAAGDKMIQSWAGIKASFGVVKGYYDGFIGTLDKLLGRTEHLNVIGGNFQLFKQDQAIRGVEIAKAIEKISGGFDGIMTGSETAAEQMANMGKAGDMAGLRDQILSVKKAVSAVSDMTGNTGDAFRKAFNDNNTKGMTTALKNNPGLLNDIVKAATGVEESLRSALDVKDYDAAGTILKQNTGLMLKFSDAAKAAGIEIKAPITALAETGKDLQNIFTNALVPANDISIALANAFNNNGAESFYQKVINNKDAMDYIKNSSDELGDAFVNAFNSHEVDKMNLEMQRHPEILNRIATASKGMGKEISDAYNIPKVQNFYNAIMGSGTAIDAVNKNAEALGQGFMDAFKGGKEKLAEMNEEMIKNPKILNTIISATRTAEQNFMSAFNTGNAVEMNKILAEHGELWKMIEKAGYKAGFMTNNQREAYVQINGLVEEQTKSLESARKEREKAELNVRKLGGSLDAVNEKKKEEQRIQDMLNNSEEKRKILMENIAAAKGKHATLTKKELADVKQLEELISNQGIQVENAMKKYEAINAESKKTGKYTEANRNAYKAYSEEVDKLNENTKRYNKILNDASSHNPFVLMARYVKALASSPDFQIFVAKMSKALDSFLNFTVNTAIPAISGMMHTIFSIVKKVASTIGKPLMQVFSALGLLFKAVFGEMADIAGDVGKKVDGGIRPILLKVAMSLYLLSLRIREIADKVGPVFERIRQGVMGIVNFIGTAFNILWPHISKLGDALLTLFGAVFSTLANAFGITMGDAGTKSEGALNKIGGAIDWVTGLIKNFSNWVSGLDAEKVQRLAKAFIGIYVALKLIQALTGVFDALMTGFTAMVNKASSFQLALKKIGILTKIQEVPIWISLYTEQMMKSLAAQKIFMGNQKRMMVLDAFQPGGFMGGKKILPDFGLKGSKMGRIGKGLVGAPIFAAKKMAKLATGGLMKGSNLLNSGAKGIFSLGKLGGGVGKLGALGKVGQVLLAPLGLASGAMGGIMGMLSAIPAMLMAAAAAAAPIVVAIVIIGTLVAGIIHAFNNNLGGFRDKVMGLVSLVKNKIAELTEKFFGMFERITGMFGSTGGSFGEMIGTFFGYIVDFASKIFDVIASVVGYLMDWVGGVAELISGIFSGNKEKIFAGIIDIYTALINIVIKLVGFITGVGAQIVAAIYGTAIEIIRWLINAVIGGLKAIGLGSILNLDGVQKGIGDFLTKVKKGVEDIPAAVAKAEEIARKLANSSSETLRKQATGKTKAEEDAQAKAAYDLKKAERLAEKKKIADAMKAEAAKKEKEEAAIAEKEWQTKYGENTDALNNNTDAKNNERSNVTNNTYVEYRAAEDDEVNRRMLERVMNDILKADVGMMMGDTSGVN